MKNPITSFMSKKSGIPKMKNPPHPPIPKGLEKGGHVPGIAGMPESKIASRRNHWRNETFDSNMEACDFINKQQINPQFIYPGTTGKVHVWWCESVND